MDVHIPPSRAANAGNEQRDEPALPMYSLDGQISFDALYDLSHTRLGDGMTAVVYIATDRATGRPCACKLAEKKGQRPAWSRLCQLLQHESKLLEYLGHHPNIVRWGGCFASPNRIAMVMELVSGGDCQQLLQRHGACSEEAVQAMICQLYSALGCAYI
jgi:serine/threonine protein kinase